MGPGFLLDCKTVHFLSEKRLGKELKHILETIEINTGNYNTWSQLRIEVSVIDIGNL